MKELFKGIFKIRIIYRQMPLKTLISFQISFPIYKENINIYIDYFNYVQNYIIISLLKHIFYTITLYIITILLNR